MVTIASNSSKNKKMVFKDVRDLILSEEIRQRELGETSCYTLNTESSGRSNNKNSNKNKSKSRQSKFRYRKKEISYWNWGKNGHLKKDCRAPKKNNGNVTEFANVVEDTSDVLILSVNSPVEFQISDSRAPFHYTSHHEIMENYISGDFKKVHLVDDETLQITGKGDIQVKLLNGTVWKLKDGIYSWSKKKFNLSGST